MEKKRTLNALQKRIIGEVNQLHFQNFKQFKKSFYNALMKCALNMNSQEVYYQCTESIQNKHNQAQQQMKTEMLSYEKFYLNNLDKCQKNDQKCIEYAQNEMRKELYNILQKFYLTAFNS